MDQQEINDDVLGRLVWDRRYEWWSGEVALSPEHAVGISVETESDDDASVLPKARRTYQRIKSELDKLLRAAATELLVACNESRNAGEAIDAEAFITRMTLSDITFYADGSAELYFDDGGMFDGNSIVVSVTADGDMDEASVAG